MLFSKKKRNFPETIFHFAVSPSHAALIKFRNILIAIVAKSEATFPKQKERFLVLTVCTCMHPYYALSLSAFLGTKTVKQTKPT